MTKAPSSSPGSTGTQVPSSVSFHFRPFSFEHGNGQVVGALLDLPLQRL
jgi:hypothetical protein